MTQDNDAAQAAAENVERIKRLTANDTMVDLDKFKGVFFSSTDGKGVGIFSVEAVKEALADYKPRHLKCACGWQQDCEWPECDTGAAGRKADGRIK